MKSHHRLSKSSLATAITTALALGTVPNTVQSDIYVWGQLSGSASDQATCSGGSSPDAASIFFTMQSSTGTPLENSSLPAGTNKNPSNQIQTPTCGTLTYDTATQSGTMEIGAFDFFNNPPSLPAEATGIIFDKLSSAQGGGNNNLILANMLFNWNGTNGIPVSLVFDASSLLAEMDGTPTTFTLNSDGSFDGAPSVLSGSGAVPATDGYYVGDFASITGLGDGPAGNPGYLALGPTPLASTAWNTTNASGCSLGACNGVSPSGVVPLVEDGIDVAKDYTANTGSVGGVGADPSGIGGNPMQSGPFQGNNANFDFTSMKLVSFMDETPPAISLNAHVSPAGTTPLTLTNGTDTYTEPGASCTDAAPLNTNLDGVVVIGGDAPATINSGPGNYTVTYDCQDPSTNDAVQVVRQVNVVAAGVPVITLSGTSPVTHECATTYTDAGASCNDPDDGNIPVGADFSLDDATNLDISSLASGQFVTWSCTDSDTNTETLDRDVNVVDTTDPVVTLLGSNPQAVASSTAENPAVYSDPGATVTDSCDTTLVSPITKTGGTVNMTVPDTGPATVGNTIEYSVSDASGNTTTVQRTVNVTRSQPVITLAGSGSTVVPVGGPYVEEGMTISDAQDGNVTTPVTASGACGTGLTCTINAGSLDVNMAGNYTVTYDVTDSNGNAATQLVRTVNVGAFATNSNFTMLDGAGRIFGGTNDVTFTWDGSTLSDPSTELTSNMTIATSTPTPFFSFVWDAHDVRVFGPGEYWFDTRCTAAQLRTQGSCGTTSDPGDPANWIHMTVPAGFVGAHMLFDWNTTDDIDVVNVWDDSGTGVWADADGQVDPTDSSGTATPKNDLHVIDNPPGIDAPDPTTTWALVSIDHNGDGVNGSPMIDGPFKGSYANFNADPADRQTPITEVKVSAPDTKLDGLSSMSLAGLLAGMLAFFGRRFSRKH